MLKGLQHLYKEKQEELFSYWRSTFFQPTAGWGVRGGDVADSSRFSSLGCDFDRLHNLGHHERHSDFADKTHYELQTDCR